MQSLSSLQHKLAFDVVASYTKKVFECTSLDELQNPSKAHILQVAALTLQEFKVEFLPKEIPPPQEEACHDEESKEDSEYDLFTHVSKECRAYLSAMKIVEVSLENDI